MLQLLLQYFDDGFFDFFDNLINIVNNLFNLLDGRGGGFFDFSDSWPFSNLPGF